MSENYKSRVTTPRAEEICDTGADSALSMSQLGAGQVGHVVNS